MLNALKANLAMQPENNKMWFPTSLKLGALYDILL